MPTPLDEATAALRSLADEIRAEHSLRYFRTGPGQYGEGDRFLGIDAAGMRHTARRFRNLSLVSCVELLESSIHEDRLLALLVMALQFREADQPRRRAIYTTYIDRTDRINNWDLVDCSAPTIVGGWLQSRSRRKLRTLARSKLIWDRRIAIVATLQFIRQGEYHDTLEVAELLLDDREDLIHKATGWMLREVAKRDRERIEQFLRENYERLPRTTLRYAIERFPEPERKAWLKGPFDNGRHGASMD